MQYDAKAIANYFINRSIAEGRPITPMMLLKLVYFANGWYLAFKGESLIKDRVQAWKFGPVIPSVYHAFKHYGTNPITEPAKDMKIVGSRSDFHFDYSEPTVNSSDEFVIKLLDKIWEVYSKFNGIQLSNLTHLPGSPWDIVYNKQGGNLRKGTDIDDALIKTYFEEQRKLNDAAKK